MPSKRQLSTSLRGRLSKRRTRGETATDRNFVIALGRGLMVLESFADRDIWQSSSNVAKAVRLPKATVSRLLRALEAMRFLHYSAKKRQYRLSTAVLSLGFAASDTYSVGELVRPHLEQLADEYSVHAALGGRDQLDIVHLEVCRSTRTLMTLNLEVGSRIPLVGTATGHALLAALPSSERDFLMSKLSSRYARSWEMIEAKVEEAKRQIRDRGYAWSAAVWQKDIYGIAVPFVRAEGVPLVLSCGAPVRLLPRQTLDEIGRRLVAIRDGVLDQLRASGDERR